MKAKDHAAHSEEKAHLEETISKLEEERKTILQNPWHMAGKLLSQVGAPRLEIALDDLEALMTIEL